MNSFTEDQLIVISKYMSGEASPEEASLLHDWLADGTAKQEFHAIRHLWGQFPGATKETDFNTLQSWREIEAHTRKTRIPRLTRRVYFLAAACVIAIAGGLTLFSMQFDSNKPEGMESRIIRRSADREITHDTLSDGSTVILNQYAGIEYASSFGQADRRVNLKSEAYFSVRPDKGKPFVIAADDLQIEVVGTSFNVREDNQKQEVTVQVTSGIVKLYNSQSELIVSKGQTGIYRRKDKDFRLVNRIDLNSIAYATGSFSFKDVPLQEVITYLHHAFHVDLTLAESRLAECRITAEFIKKSLPYILDVISATLNTTYEKEGEQIIIHGQGCD